MAQKNVLALQKLSKGVDDPLSLSSLFSISCCKQID
jgi:hypothetical protein